METFITVHLKDGPRNYGVGSIVYFEESDLAEDNTGGFAPNPICEVTFDGAPAIGPETQPEPGVRYKVVEVFEPGDPERAYTLDLEEM